MFKFDRIKEWLKTMEIKYKEDSINNYVAAFTHPSYKGIYPNEVDYERMEFLGDAVLELISAEKLVKEHDLSEGVMTEKRKQLVNNEYLSQVFDKLKIKPPIRVTNDYRLTSDDKADFIEALFGAHYLDMGMESCKELWDLIQMGATQSESDKDTQEMEQEYSFFRFLNISQNNPISILKELQEKRMIDEPKYEEINRVGEAHNLVFTYKVTVILRYSSTEKVYTGTATAKSIKNAKREAADKVCREIASDYKLEDR